MTSRRSFFRSLALLTGTASVSPTIFIPKFEPVRWKPSRRDGEWRREINPDYETARYQIRATPFRKVFHRISS